jgi:hypothetical protein
VAGGGRVHHLHAQRHSVGRCVGRGW